MPFLTDRARNAVGVAIEVEVASAGPDGGHGERGAAAAQREANSKQRAAAAAAGAAANGATGMGKTVNAGMLYVLPAPPQSSAGGAAPTTDAIEGVEVEFACLCLSPPQEDGGVRSLEARLELLSAPQSESR